MQQPVRRFAGIWAGARRIWPVGPWLLAVSVALWSQGAVAIEDGERFKDWTAQCEKADDKQPKRCVILQTLVDNETNKPVLQMTVGYLDQGQGQGKQPVALIHVPLGVILPAGVGIKIDNKEIIRIPYERCDPAGCMAGLALNEELIAALKGGSKGQIIIQGPSGRPVALDISLNGFTAGFNALR